MGHMPDCPALAGRAPSTPLSGPGGAEVPGLQRPHFDGARQEQTGTGNIRAFKHLLWPVSLGAGQVTESL